MRFFVKNLAYVSLEFHSIRRFFTLALIFAKPIGKKLFAR